MNVKNTPVLIIIFNRPDKVRALMKALAKVQPARLYVAGDGPRDNRPNEKNLCEEARSTALTGVTWPCQVTTRFQDQNLGCKQGVSSAITWFFTQEKEGIILEDDCLPVPGFFDFATTLLNRYRDDEQIMHINGTSFLTEEESENVAYYFSHIPHSWGWATWRRAWQHYDGEMLKISDLEKIFSTRKVFMRKKHSSFFIKLFRHVKIKNLNSWATPWAYSVMSANGLVITPGRNLITNIGFDLDATHTGKTPKYIQKTGGFNPEQVNEKVEKIVNLELDAKVMERVFMRSFWDRFCSPVKKCYDLVTKVLGEFR